MECGELGEEMHVVGRPVASTEPHSLECGEMVNVLQVLGAQLASTEPHSLECGEEARRSSMASSPPGFNGAALVGVRRG